MCVIWAFSGLSNTSQGRKVFPSTHCSLKTYKKCSSGYVQTECCPGRICWNTIKICLIEKVLLCHDFMAFKSEEFNFFTCDIFLYSLKQFFRFKEKVPYSLPAFTTHVIAKAKGRNFKFALKKFRILFFYFTIWRFSIFYSPIHYFLYRIGKIV